MRYPEEIIEEVRTRSDIVDIIGGYVALKRAGSRYTGLCPFHNEKTPSFSVNRDKQMYYCFGCHASGNVFTFLMQYNNMSFTEALQYLADRASITLPEQHYSREQKERADRRTLFLEINKKAAAYYYHLLRKEDGARAMKYLTDRGLTPETIHRFGLGYSGKSGRLYEYLKGQGYNDGQLADSGLFSFDERRGGSDRFWNRVMFPIMDAQSRVIGFGGRVMGDAKPKYLNSPETDFFNKRRHLFGLNYARSSRRKELILCEGYMDVITMHQAGFDSAVASLGTALTEEQAALMRRYTQNVYLIYDSDRAGRMAAVRAVPILRNAGISPRIVNLTPHKDPDEFIKAEGAEAFEERLKAARDGFLFTIDEMEKEYSMSDPQQRTRFQHETARRIASIEDDLERNNYILTTSREKSIPEDGLRKLVNRYLAAGTPAENYREPKKTGPVRKAKAEEGDTAAERLLLGYLAAYPSAYEATKDYLGPEDFHGEITSQVAEALYTQLRAGPLDVAQLLTCFEEAETQSQAAAILNAGPSAEDQGALDRAFTDIVIRVMTDSNNARMKALSSGDAAVLQPFIETKRRIEELKGGRGLHLPMDEKR